MLELSGVTKSYGEVEVLRGIDLTVAAGETVAIVGPSGSGKSTLLNIMGALDLPTAGSVTVNGRDVASLDEKALSALRRDEIGFVFQLHHLLPQLTAIENVLVPTLPRRSTASDHHRAAELLDRVGLSERDSHRPGELSGGERQRVAVVRALINRPGVVLADEPTGSLDHEAAELLFDLLLDLARDEGVALVLVTHARELAARAGRLLELRDGVLVQT